MKTQYADIGSHPAADDFKELPPVIRILALVADNYRTISEMLANAAGVARADRLGVYDELAEMELATYKQWQAFEVLAEDLHVHFWGPKNETGITRPLGKPGSTAD